ncbi:hypothetical protein AOC36_03905 [Erysipelothrix larvae]|uniref:Solute-binding protein family 5 domain-containing protein n=1 Tax=Erysipelothrix larvae TaxID=1514105 RepID=A0A0X8GZ91_9FIRM|nr:ABC transporter substrate-binding protein [Erysipelothrix larvae]AMC93146.1 hypothetical protein AOC36_03905 [Erysipelothrix larvae]
MKKLLAVFLSALLVLTGCGGSGTALVEDQSAETFTIGVPAAINGSFVPGFTNSSYDLWIMNALYGYGVYYNDRDTGEYKVNPTVATEEVTENADGSKTYTFTIKDGLKYSDGEAVTAKDYVFQVLWRASKAWNSQATLDASVWKEIVGYADYQAGGEFTGVKLVDDKTFSLTIDGEYLPYFYEKAYVAASPYPSHVYFPGMKLNADGNKFENTDAEIVAAVDQVATKERFAPTISWGPYKFVSNQDSVVTLDLNAEYAGNYEGAKAEIGKLVFREVDSSQAVDALKRGEIDISAGNVEGDYINEVRAEDSGLAFTSYPRNGYGMISFKTQKTTTAVKEVRQAVGYLLNRNAFVESIAGGYGKVVDGPYGLSSWFYQERSEEITNVINQYALNVSKATELLDSTDYIYNEDGSTPWDSAKSTYRYNKAGEQLVIYHAGSENNQVTDLINSTLVPNAKEVGINYVIDYLPFSTLLNYYYGLEENKYGAFNLASGFTAIYDRESELSMYADVESINTSQINSPELDATINKMRFLDSAERDAFADAFVEYVDLWNDILPELPLYSNEYHDFFTKRVTGYDGKITSLSDFSENFEYLRIQNVD